MTILKVQLNDEIRRITLDNTCFSLTDLESKVRLMFPQLVFFTMSFRDDDNNLIEIKTDEDLHLGCAQANARFPPIFRVLITETAEKSTSSSTQHHTSQEQTESEEGAASTSTSEDESSINGACSDCSAKFSATAARFKCMNCLEVVLCESCESKCVHNPIHLLVKLRQPSSQLSLMQQLIFTSHIEDSKEKLIAKAQTKAIRRALREVDENSRKKKEERMKARKERMKRRAVSRCKKLEENREKREKLRLKKAAAATVESAEDIPALVPVEPFTLNTSTPVNVVEPVRDASPQPLVEEVVKEQDSVAPVADEPESPETEVKEEFVDVETSEAVEEEKVEEESDEVETQPWNVLGLMNSFKIITGRNNTAETASGSPTPVKVNNYRIQGFSFAKKLEELEAMGFTDKSKNVVVLMKNLSNLERAVDELTSK